MADKQKNVTGWNDVRANLKKAKAALAIRLPQGLKIAGLHLQAESQKLVPVDTGNLKGSAFTRLEGTGLKTVASIGYTAKYAAFVHEHPNGLNPGRFGRPRPEGHKGNFWDPEGIGQSKFLEQPSRNSNNRRIMLNIVRNVCKLTGKDISISGGSK